jgi:hypothetical protein
MAQSVAISDDGSVADGSAILEVKSTTKEFLPRMNKDQRDAITATVAGFRSGVLIVDLQPLCIFYNGVVVYWRNWNYFKRQATAITDNTKSHNRAGSYC